MPRQTVSAEPRAETVLDLLSLVPVDDATYRSTHVDGDAFLFGGQVVAQALMAAGLTVSTDRTPHSLHCYFLQPGDARLPVSFAVVHEREGRSFSARRVLASQGTKDLLSLTASFHVPVAGTEADGVVSAPETVPPTDLPDVTFSKFLSVVTRRPPQPWPDSPRTTRFWARTAVPLPDSPLVQACALAYVSDVATGLGPLTTEQAGPGPSVDHALWFHRPANLQDWVLADLVPLTAAHGRGLYSGSYWQDGALVATLMQESLFGTRS